MLWLCLNFPKIAIEALIPKWEDVNPTAIIDSGQPPQIIAFNKKAQKIGLQKYMSLSSAFAISSELQVFPRSIHKEIKHLEDIATWALQYSSHTSVQPPDCVLIEIGSSIKLFGGLESLTLKITKSINALGHTTIMSSATTPLGAAWLARSGFNVHLQSRKELENCIYRLPVSLIGNAQQVNSIRSFGIRTIGEIAQLPRKEVTQRLGADLLDKIDRAIGVIPDPQPPTPIPEHFKKKLELTVPTEDLSSILFGIRRMVIQLESFLSLRNTGTTHFAIHLKDESLKTHDIRFKLSRPSRNSKHLTDLIRERLNQETLPSRTESITLECLNESPLSAQNFSLLPDQNQTTEDGIQLIEKLRARLGYDNVFGISSIPDGRPEKAWAKNIPGKQSKENPSYLRPTWLLPKPKKLYTKDNNPLLDGPLIIIDGPERIETGWWDEQDTRRDYFVARTTDHALIWIFRELPEGTNWFLHGIFS